MHFHLPKPLHGWREFAGEVGIIVLGVLIALGAEQIVETIHDNQLRRETEHMARAELARALGEFVNRRLLEPCMERRFGEVDGLLSGSEKPGYVPPSWIGRPQIWAFEAGGWDAATAGGRVALLDLGEQRVFGTLYSQLRELAELEREEQKSWADIRQLENLRNVDAETRSTVRSALSQARLLNWNIRVDLEQPIATAERMGIVQNLTASRASPSICLPLTTPRANAVRQIDAFFGDNLGEP